MTILPISIGKRLIAVAAVAVAFGGVLVAPHASAESVSNSINTMKVSPVRTDIEIKAGEKKEVAITVTNLTKSDVKIRPMTNDFVAGDEKGTPSLILDETEFAKSHSLKRFMSVLNEEIIPANDSKTIKVVISVPKDAQAGGYFGAVRFMPSTPAGGGQVNMSPSVASLILLTVPGALVEKLELTDFQIQQSGVSKSVFRQASDLEATFRFKSTGNVQVGPFGKMSVKKDNKVIYSADFNASDPRDMVLPDGARRWNVPIEKVGGFGRYTVAATLTYGTKNQTIEVSKTFWVIPMSVILGSVAAGIILVLLLAGTWWYFKKRSRRGKSTTRRTRN